MKSFNVYQETVKELHKLNAPRQAVVYCSNIAFDLEILFAGGSTIPELAQKCIKESTC